MKKRPSPFHYPVVLRQHMSFLTISVPDLGISLIEELPENQILNKDYISKIGLKVAEAWLKAQKIIQDKHSVKKYLPTASMTKDSIQKAEKDLTPTQFASLVGISARTITRDCGKGLIRAKRTSGGHYKIPIAQVSIYKEYLKRHKKHANEKWLDIAMSKFQDLQL
jgi:excisionase family DNA binding protein